MEWLWVAALLLILAAPVLIGLVRGARHQEIGTRGQAEESEEIRTIRAVEDLRNQRERRQWR